MYIFNYIKELKINNGETEYLGTDQSEELQINGNTIPVLSSLSIWDQ
jgi:hypothetical protein